MKYTIKVLAVLAVIATAVSCSEKSEWTPGPDVAPGCMGVYFGQMGSYDLLVGPDDSRQIPVTVGRGQSDAAADVEFVVNSIPEGATFPSSVSFEAGEMTKTVYINVENMPAKTSGTLSVAIPESMVSPYAAGTSELTMKISVSGQWKLFAEDADVCFGHTYDDMKTNIYLLDGTYNFRLPDFLASGVDFIFTFKDPLNDDFTYVPVSGYQDVHDYYGASYEYNGWFLYDEDANDHPYWAPDGVNYLWDLEFDADYSYGSRYKDGYLHFSAMPTLPDGSYGAWLDIYVYFKPLFDPFSVTPEE